MQVTLLNPEVLKNLYKNHGEFACECYDTDKKYATKVGKSCETSGHMSGSRCEYIKFEIEADRGTLEQMMRSEIGVRYNPEEKYYYMDMLEAIPRVSPDEIVKNMQSFRYVDKNNFTYVTPATIANNPLALSYYQNLMSNIDTTRKIIKKVLIESGGNEHKAVEDANFVLPRATNTKLTIGFTPEALIRFMQKRLCVRAQPEIRAVAVEMRKQVKEVNEEFANRELLPHCQYLLWCPEGKKSCGAYPTRDELKEKVASLLKNQN